MKYIYQLKDWPTFSWDVRMITDLLAQVRHKQGRLVGRMEGMGFHLQSEATLQTITLDVLKSSEIEGEFLNHQQVRSSVARRLGIDIAGLVQADRNIEGVVEMMLDATQHYEIELDSDRFFAWHAALFPTGRSGLRKITVGTWRENAKDDPMQVFSGPMGRERVHFQAPDSNKLVIEMTAFLSWYNNPGMDPVLKAAIAHLWFVTIHPFDDGNGRIARAITDMQLARADESTQRFYSMSAQIKQEKNKYYDILESTQKGTMDITKWLVWFLNCLDQAFDATESILTDVFRRASFWEKHATTTMNGRQTLMLIKLLEGFVGKLKSSKWAKIANCSQDTAGRDINDLIDRGILKKESAGGRSTSYVLID